MFTNNMALGRSEGLKRRKLAEMLKTIFGLKLHPTSGGGSQVTESWFNGDPKEFRSPGEKKNIRLIDSIIKNIILKIGSKA